MDVKTAGRTVDLFELFARARTPLKLSEVARALGAPQSSCFNLVRALETRGFLYMLGDSKRIYPTRRLFEIAEAIVEFEPIVPRVQQRLAELRDETAETVILGTRQNDRVVYLAVLESQHTIRYTSRAGDSKPIHASAIGKALLMALAPDDRAALVARLPIRPITARTMTTPEALLAEVASSKQRGYSQSCGENVVDVMAVACPGKANGVIYAVGVAGPIDRMAPLAERHAASIRAAINDLFPESPTIDNPVT